MCGGGGHIHIGTCMTMCHAGLVAQIGAAMAAQVLEQKIVDYWVLMYYKLIIIVSLTDHFTAEALNF